MLKNIANDYAIIDFNNYNLIDILQGKKDISTLNNKTFKWDMKSGSKISDCPFYIGAFPVFDSTKLKVNFEKDVKTAEITVDGRKYKIILANQIKGNVIDKNKSEYSKYSDGRIMKVDKYVFKSNINYPSIFTIEEFPLFTFCDEEMKRKLESCHFNQLMFINCNVL